MMWSPVSPSLIVEHFLDYLTSSGALEFWQRDSPVRVGHSLNIRQTAIRPAA
jgi:hypothetical protein